MKLAQGSEQACQTFEGEDDTDHVLHFVAIENAEIEKFTRQCGISLTKNGIGITDTGPAATKIGATPLRQFDRFSKMVNGLYVFSLPVSQNPINLKDVGFTTQIAELLI